MKTGTVAKLAYIAGLVDGEGMIGLSRSAKRGNHNHAYAGVCTITNTDQEIHSWLIQTTGIGIVDPRIRGPKDKPCWVWRLRSYEQKDFLLAILPYLKIKKQQADLLLEFLVIERRTQIGVPDHDSAYLKDIIFDELADLNKRGV